VHDPLYSDEELRALGFEPFQLGMACEGMLLQADHVDYQDLTIGDLPGVQGVVDGRGILDPAYWFDNSVAFAALGRGDLI
jgi:hypothetical protein